MRKRKVEQMRTFFQQWRKHLIYAVAIALAAYVLLLSFACIRLGNDYKDLLFLTQCKGEDSILRHFARRPEIVYHRGEAMPMLGWKLPNRRISNKVLIYTNKSSLRFYIFIDENGMVEYVFTSYS